LKEAILTAIDQEKTAGEEGSESLASSARKGLTRLNILLVEDNEKNRMLLNAFLKNTPYNVETAEHGKIAVDKFMANPYDLVLMDIDMPVMDGYTATKTIRQWEKENQLRAAPIIALSAHALTEHSQKSIDAGCNTHLTKPIKKQNLLAAIEKHALGIDH